MNNHKYILERMVARVQGHVFVVLAAGVVPPQVAVHGQAAVLLGANRVAAPQPIDGRVLVATLWRGAKLHRALSYHGKEREEKREEVRMRGANTSQWSKEDDHEKS